MNKNLTRCKVCADIHFGRESPEVCPTCKSRNAYLPIEKDAAKKEIGF